MSTRATVHFTYKAGDKPVAIIYRHSDGYPHGLGIDLVDFLKEVQRQTKDTRFSDPSYLAAKWVVWDSGNGDPKKRGHLGFLGVGIVDEDPGDIEYRYTVVCNGNPTITNEKIERN